MAEEEVTKENSAQIIESYNETYKDLQTEISELRKAGKDPLIADYLLRTVKAKIEWAKHNMKAEDFEKVEDIFRQVKMELKEASEREVIDVKKEIEERLKSELSDNQASEGEKPVRKQVPKDVEKKPEAPAEIPKSKPAEKPEVGVAEPAVSEEKTEEIKEPEAIKEKAPEHEAKEQEPAEKQPPKKRNFKVLTDTKKFFYFRNGQYFSSIPDMVEKLPQIPDELFDFHMENNNNDFANWINDVFNDPELAKKIKGVKEKQEMIGIIQAYERGE